MPKKKPADIRSKVMKWKDRCTEAFGERERLYKDTELRDFEKYIYNRRFNTDSVAGKKMYDINLISVMLRRLVASVYFRNPKLLIRSLSKEGDWAVPIITRLWNTKIRQLDLKGEIRMAIQDAFTCGWGAIKIGYDSEFAIDSLAKEESESESKLVLPTELRSENRIAAGSPWWLRVHPSDIAIQAGARNVISGDWGVHRYFRRIDDLKADERFSNTAKLKPDIDLSLAKKNMQFAYAGDLASDISQSEGLVLLYEIRDLVTGRMMVCAANQLDKWLFNEIDEITSLIDRLPFYFVVFNPLSKSPYGVSTVDLLDKPQKEFNDIRTQDAKQRRVSILKILAKANVLDQDAMEALTDEDVGPVVEINGQMTDVQAFQPHQGMDMQIPAENCRRDMRELSGLGRNQMAEQTSGRHTALEMGNVQAAFDLMIGFYRGIVADVILDLVGDGHKLIAGTPAVKGFWTDQRTIDFIGSMGQSIAKPFRGTDLVGDYSFEMSVDTAPPPSRMQIKQERALIGQSLQDHPRVNQDYLLRYVAEAFDDLDGDRLIIPEEQYNEAMKQTMQAQQQQQQAATQQDEASKVSADERARDTKIAVEAVKSAGQSPPNKGKSEK